MQSSLRSPPSPAEPNEGPRRGIRSGTQAVLLAPWAQQKARREGWTRRAKALQLGGRITRASCTQYPEPLLASNLRERLSSDGRSAVLSRSPMRRRWHAERRWDGSRTADPSVRAGYTRSAIPAVSMPSISLGLSDGHLGPLRGDWASVAEHRPGGLPREVPHDARRRFRTRRGQCG